MNLNLKKYLISNKALFSLLMFYVKILSISMKFKSNNKNNCAIMFVINEIATPNNSKCLFDINTNEIMYITKKLIYLKNF